MEACKPVLNTGLRGVTIASTKVSDVDGAKGKLIYRGYLVKDLAGKATFEEVVHLLLFERLPDQGELAAIRRQIADQRAIPAAILTAMQGMPKDALPMDVLQATVPMLANYDPDIRNFDIDSAGRMAIRLIAKFPTIVAAWDRIRNGKAPIDPDPALSQAANLLHMLSGEAPDDELTGFMDAALVLHAEHSFNASTFAAREVASTKAHMYAAVAAGVGSLSGPLHGGANTRVMQMLLAIGDVDKVDDYIANILDTGGVIMGLGHAVYQVDDPRAHILAPMSLALGQRSGDTRWYDLSKALEVKGKAAFKQRKGKDIFVNVDFYSASLYYYMGIAVDLFTPIFAISRIAGWCAHVIEEQFGGAEAKPTLYRPESDYIGDYCGPDECAFVPLNERKPE
ncbi:citrate/2-methylcitrate synthase [Desulfosarcina ovata]|uniref:Citrate synthase n=1 Tax=Desulfosarcina ovata subsp. ovata TaxID=2752305 RepID=A0A5K8ACI6_9BACT|nr:citrate/2-methylcitrate synthase [Desulfosarcina ovata]BBO90251.1 citrate (Si)-synthase [Desulfosarcina ovata subsp. ovata]